MPDPNYILVDDCAFLLPAKCANTSIKQALLLQRNEPVDVNDPLWFVRIHSGEMFCYATCKQQAFEARRVVGVVREPVARLVSLWCDKVANVDKLEFRTPGNVTPRMSWGEFVDCVVNDDDSQADQHWRSLTYDLVHKRMPDTILRTQCLRDDWVLLERSLGWPHKGVPRLNASSGVPLPAVTRSQQRKIHKRYAEDYVNFSSYFV